MENLIGTVTTGDARKLIKLIENESIDLIFTDPVYERVKDYRWLARTAMRTLKPNSACLAWVSKNKLSQCQAAMSTPSGLIFETILFYTVVAKQVRPIFLYGFMNWTTPCLVFAKGTYKCKPFLVDTFRDTTPTQNKFDWQKNTAVLEHWLKAFSKPGDLVLDPFAGSGSLGIACKQTGRRYIGFEIDPERAEMARRRIEQAPMPMFILDEQEQQLNLAI